MNRITTLLITPLVYVTVSAAGLSFSGNERTVLSETPGADTGLEKIYIVGSTTGIQATYTAASAASVTVQKFGSNGAAYAEDVPAADILRSGNDITLTRIEPDMGYSFTDAGRTYYFWITDYSRHSFDVNALNIDPEQDCNRAFLNIDGTADRIIYYSINGRAYTLDRDITLTYTSLQPDEADMRFTDIEKTEHLPYIASTFNVEIPLCNTYFLLSGDKFLRQWGLEQEISSPLYTTEAVSAIVAVEQQTRNNDNEIKAAEDIGGSAPAEISFNATVTDAAIFTEWQMASDDEFEDITFRSPDTNLDYTFRDMGTTYVRFVAANASGTCEYFSDIYTVYIGESRLQCPNAFSPGTSEGVNDEWKVSYKSIISFECYIFNRWGEKMAEFHDPAQGWDGKKGGKLVPAGVYYYVIKATGSDGKKYNLSGDINILRSSVNK